LRRLEEFIDQRRKIARRYDRAFADLPELVIPKVSDGIRHAWHLYIVMLRPEMLKISRDEFILALKAEGIGTGIHFRSVHLQPWYRDRFGFRPDSFPNAAKTSDRIISLPLYPKMDSRDVESVIRGVRKLVEHYR
jgi:dTDP-4-amino-4,6-dideoxygalactose transaminase